MPLLLQLTLSSNGCDVASLVYNDPVYVVHLNSGIGVALYIAIMLHTYSGKKKNYQWSEN